MAVEWGSVADWVSGLGSFAAVVTALYLARAASRIKLTGYCGVRVSIGGGAPKTELMLISVTNIGSRSATINNIGLTVGRLRKRYVILTAVQDSYSDGVPVTIGDGQVAKWGIPLGDADAWLKDFAKDFILTDSDARSLRIVIYTTHGYDKVLKPEQPLVDRIRQVLDSDA